MTLCKRIAAVILCAGLLSLLLTGILLRTCRLAAPDFGKRATFTAVLAVQAAVTAEVLLDCLLGTGLLTAILHSRPDTALPSPEKLHDSADRCLLEILQASHDPRFDCLQLGRNVSHAASPPF